MDFPQNWEKLGLKFLITKKMGEIEGFKSVRRKSGERDKNQENPGRQNGES